MDRLALERDVNRAQGLIDNLHPEETHNAGGDCLNPKCDYHFTPQDEQEIQQDHGWFVCPKCHMSYNLYEDPAATGGRTRAATITPTQMGGIGETILVQMGTIPEVGQVFEHYAVNIYNNPIDLHVGPYGVEVKTIHSESAPRFKLTGGGARSRQEAIATAIAFCDTKGLIPAMIGVRLNFYTDIADIFFRTGLKDTYIGSANMPHIASVSFKDLNPFPNPESVPPPADLPEGDSDIPF